MEKSLFVDFFGYEDSIIAGYLIQEGNILLINRDWPLCNG